MTGESHLASGDPCGVQDPCNLGGSTLVSHRTQETAILSKVGVDQDGIGVQSQLLIGNRIW